MGKKLCSVNNFLRKIMRSLLIRNISGRSIAVNISPTDTIINIKKKIERKEGIFSQYQKIFLGGKLLDEEEIILNHDLQVGSTFNILTCLDGGVIEPSLQVLAKKYNCDKIICRKCYARLYKRAVNCRKKKCGRTTQLRPKKKLK